MDKARQTQVYFDGSCPLCTAEIGVYRQKDRSAALRFVDVTADGALLPAALDPASARARFHVMTEGGDLLSGAAAFVAVWRQLPGWRWLAGIAALPGVVPVLEVGYRLFLHSRPLVVRLFLALRRGPSAAPKVQ